MKFLLVFTIIYVYSTICITVDTQIFLTRNKTQEWYRNVKYNISSGNPYCSICCINTSRKALGKKCGKHTMCIYPEGKAGAACKGFLNVPFTDGEIEAIVDVHNTIRNKVALGIETRGDPGPLPQASNMKALEWDQELALVAGRWADQCIFSYDICRDIARYPVGQNIAKGSYAFNNAISFIFDWYDSVDMLKEEDIKLFKIKSTDALSQYTQLIWAETYQIGCARVVFQQALGANVTYREQFICNYGPTGNIPSQPIYKIGEPCSNCADGTACTVEYQGLCGREMAFDISLERHVDKKDRVQNDDNGGRFGGSNIFLNIFHYTLSMYVILM